MRSVKTKVFAVGSLLACFMAAGAVLIWQESNPEIRPENQTGFADYLYQNPFDTESPNASAPMETRLESTPHRAIFMLWLAGFPLAVLGGFAAGLIIRRAPDLEKLPLPQSLQYTLIESAPMATVLKKAPPATGWDNGTQKPGRQAKNPRYCPTRSRLATSSSRRENQPREI